MATYSEAISAAYEGIISIVGSVNLHIVPETWAVYEHNANIRENAGRTRLFALETPEKWAEPITTYSDVEDTQTTVNIVIGYDRGPEYELAARADILSIMHKLNNPESVPDGVSFYLSNQEPNWEDTDTFRWANLPVIVHISSTTE